MHHVQIFLLVSVGLTSAITQRAKQSRPRLIDSAQKEVSRTLGLSEYSGLVTCESSGGNPAPDTLMWLVDGRVVNKTSTNPSYITTNTSVGVRSTLTWRNLRRYDKNRNVTCRTSQTQDGWSNVNETFVYVIVYSQQLPPRLIDSAQKTLSWRLGLPVYGGHVTCESSTGSPAPDTLTWLVDGRVVYKTSTNPSYITANSSVGVRSTLTWKKLSPKDTSRNVTCRTSQTQDGWSNVNETLVYIEVHSPPEPPTDLNVGFLYTTEAELIWSPGNNGGLGENYWVQRKTGHGYSDITPAVTMLAAEDLYTESLTGLVPNTEHEVRVRMKTDFNGGTIVYSNSITFTTCIVPEVSYLSVEERVGQATIMWQHSRCSIDSVDVCVKALQNGSCGKASFRVDASRLPLPAFSRISPDGLCRITFNVESRGLFYQLTLYHNGDTVYTSKSFTSATGPGLAVRRVRDMEAVIPLSFSQAILIAIVVGLIAFIRRRQSLVKGLAPRCRFLRDMLA